ncbi:MAG: YkgJ family cysteine cluster protein [Candidatus Heimdallarchaeota archaeon]|nr:MAG: YkgJ family cysteine cluster protein [Candidatus Heimdallarchaeota archaeon]
MDLKSLGERRFECQQSGHCCSDPNIIVTLTYRDLFRLFNVLNKDFRILLQKVSFYKLEEYNQVLEEQMVLEPIQTSEGNVIPGLRKIKEFCAFFARPNCRIYPDRPMSCRSYPLAYIQRGERIVCTWVKNSRKTCPGIGKGAVLSQTFIKNLGKKYFHEIETHNYVVGELNKEAINGRPLTARGALWVLITYGEKDRK